MLSKSKKKISVYGNKKMMGLFSYTVPNIVVVGDEYLRRDLANMERNFNVNLVFVDSDMVMQVLGEQTIAVIIDEKVVEENLVSFMDETVEKFKMLPVFLLSRQTRSDSSYLDIYEKGVYGILDWPEQQGIVADLLVESLKPHPRAVGKTRADDLLAEMV